MDMVDSLLLTPDMVFALSQTPPRGDQQLYSAHKVHLTFGGKPSFTLRASRRPQGVGVCGLITTWARETGASTNGRRAG